MVSMLHRALLRGLRGYAIPLASSLKLVRQTREEVGRKYTFRGLGYSAPVIKEIPSHLLFEELGI